MKKTEFQHKWAEIIAKAWADEDFKRRLLAHPEKVLHEFGILTPQGEHIRIVENTSNTKYIILPERPEGSLSPQELKKVAAAAYLITMPEYVV